MVTCTPPLPSIQPSCMRSNMKRISRFLSLDISKSVDPEEDCWLLSPSEPRKFTACIAFNGFHLEKKLRNGPLTPISTETHVITGTGNEENTKVDAFPDGAEEIHEITAREINGRTESDRFPDNPEDPKTRSVRRSSSWLPDRKRRWPVQGW